MCDEIPEDRPIIEAIQESNKKGWFPVITIMAKVEGEDVDLTHVHYLWNIDPPAALTILWTFIKNIQAEMLEEAAKEEWEHDHRN